MADAIPDSRSSTDVARGLLDEWKLSGESEFTGSSLARMIGEDGSVLSSAAGLSQAVPAVGWQEASHDLVAGFALAGSTNDTTVPRDILATVDHGHPASPSVPVEPMPGSSGERQSHPGDGILQPGAELAGFRIILELGRGAFARVYLAEEINLGRRLVAVKVSRPDGDEPRILARLQHGHIVPVHSVHDDPETGHRFLCMPYFGGADLARVLRASGGLVPTGHDGGSLVKALDQVSRKLPDAACSTPSHPTVRRLRSLHASQSRSEPPWSLLMPRGIAASSTAFRFRGLISRFVGAAPALPVHPDRSAADREEPSRQFLRSATAIQAATWIIERLAEGLAHAHDRGLLHRDLKPSNILLAADGTPMLLDFNLAVENPAGSPEGEINRALIGGTLPYMSPEHIDAFSPRGQTSADAVDERSDIYALGLIFFELLAGAPPFPDPPAGAPLLEILDQMIACRRRPPSLRAHCPQAPWSLDALTARCLAFDPARRYARAADLAEDLKRFLDHLPMKHCPEPSIRERMGKFARRHPGLCGSTSIAIVATLLIGLLGAAVALIHDKIQDLSARVNYRVFDQRFTQVQFLLNTADSSDERLKKGIDQATQAIAMVGDIIESPARRDGWVQRLTQQEGRRLREQLIELMMLEARAQVSLASRSGRRDERDRSIERAIDRLDRAERIDPAPPSALFVERARYHYGLDHVELARRDQELALRITPTTCHDLTLLATSRLSGGDHHGAERALREALRLDVTSLWARFVLGHCHYAQGRFLESAGDFAACSVSGPGFAWIHFNRGLALARAGRPLDARYAYDQALELDPTFSEALVNRGMVELELNQLTAAEADLRRAIELGRDDVVAMTSLGETLARLDRRADAERFFASLLVKDPHSLVARVARGFTRIATDPAGAQIDLRLALDQDPHHAHALLGMALLLRHTQPQKALEHLNDALQADPNLIDAVQLRALVRARLADPAALDDVERLIQSPTPYHLYNAACALAVYSEKANEPRCASRALDVLARAVDAGVSPSEAAADPDLGSLRRSSRFDQIIKRRANR